MTVCHPLDAPSGGCLANAAEHAARTALTPQQRFERLKRQITSAFSLPLTFYDIDVESLDESHIGVRHQHVDSPFAAYMHSTGYCAHMDRGSTRSAAVSLIFVLDGTMSLMQNGNANTMRPGEAYLFHAARPAHFSFKTPFQEVIVGIPYEALSRFVPNLDRYTAIPLALTPNLKLLRSLAYATANTAATCGSHNGAQTLLAETFTSLAGFALAELFRQDASRVLRSEALLLIVQNYIESHLADPDLSPEKFALANNMSQRTLFALFKNFELSVMDWLWSKRLSHARMLLTDAGLAHVSTAEIGYASGFKSPAHFSARFKKAYALTPTEYQLRNLQLGR